MVQRLARERNPRYKKGKYRVKKANPNRTILKYCFAMGRRPSKDVRLLRYLLGMTAFNFRDREPHPFDDSQVDKLLQDVRGMRSTKPKPRVEDEGKCKEGSTVQ